MSRFPRLLVLLSVLLLPKLQVIAWASDDAVNTLIGKLAESDGQVRAEAATELRRLLPGDFGARTNNHGRLYWEQRLAQVKPGMKHEEVLEILPPIDDHIGGMGSGQSHSKLWRLDDYWTVVAYYNNPDIVHEMRPELRCRARSVWVDPAESFTGMWTTWHVNGQKSHEIEYKNGKYNGRFISMHDNGRKSCEQHYIDGTCSGSDRGWYADGSKAYEGQYVDGKRDGTWTHWYQDGRLQSLETLRMGRRHGVATSWHESGQKRYESSYQNDEKHGSDKAWDWDGTLLWTREYRNGDLIH